MKKSLAILSAILVLGLVGCGKPKDTAQGNARTPGEKSVVLIAATTSNDTHPYARAVTAAKEWLEKNNSSVTIETQFGTLGGEREIVESTLLGSTDIVTAADMLYASFAPKIMFVNFPGLMNNYDDVKKLYMNGWIGEEALKILNEVGFEPLAILDNGFRWITNSKRPITKTSDLRGLKLRVPEVKFIVDFFNELGTVNTPLPFPDLATALQQKVVDGCEIPLSSLYPYAMYEFNQYFTPAYHSYSAAIHSMNKKKFDSLSPKQQQELKEAFWYGSEAITAELAESYTLWEKDMIAKGTVISQPDPSMAQDFAVIGKKLANNEYYSKIFGQELIAKMYP